MLVVNSVSDFYLYHYIFFYIFTFFKHFFIITFFHGIQKSHHLKFNYHDHAIFFILINFNIFRQYIVCTVFNFIIRPLCQLNS